jgi:vancomycin resistance protein YoaR
MPVSNAPIPERSSRLPVIIGVIALVAAFVGGGIAYQRIHAFQAMSLPDKMAVGVTVAGVPVGGLSREEARDRVRRGIVAQLNQSVTFVAPQSGRRWNLPLAEVGGRFEWQDALDAAYKVGKNATLWEQILQGGKPYTVNVTPAFRLNEVAINKQLTAIARTVNRPAEDAHARIGDNGQIWLASHEQKGIALDTVATTAALLKNGPESLRNGGTVNLVVREERPRVVAADLGKMSTLLASFTTEYSSSTEQRSHNVELAASKINGTVLAPGEEFSYNKTVGERDAKGGWQSALMFEDGEVVPSLGGGVCQVASTLYNAVLRADLKVKERRNHSIKVHYVEPGRDATVVFGAQDFRFENSSGAPIIVLARTHHRMLTMNIFGAGPKPKDQIELASGPYRNNELGGITVATYRIIHHADGKVTREYLHTDSYRAVATRESKKKSAVRDRTGTSPVTIRPASSKLPPAPKPTAPAA